MNGEGHGALDGVGVAQISYRAHHCRGRTLHGYECRCGEKTICTLSYFRTHTHIRTPEALDWPRSAQKSSFA